MQNGIKLEVPVLQKRNTVLPGVHRPFQVAEQHPS
jgi:hypothetical protein